MLKTKTRLFLFASTLFVPFGMMATPSSSPTHPTIETKKIPQKKEVVATSTEKNTSFKPFTGKILGEKVRMRTGPDLESFIVREFHHNDLVVVLGEKNDFYVIKPPSDVKAYIFRSFVLDDIVEGTRVNVRLSPDRDAPVIAHLSSGVKINGKISEENNKWLEIDPPETSAFYVAKEFIEYMGGPELKEIKDKRRASVIKTLDSTNLLSQSELRKGYDEINASKVEEGYKMVINEYSDFPNEVQTAQKALALFQEKYLQKKIAFLEKKANQINHKGSIDLANANEMDNCASDRMQIWESVEESLYLSWSAMHHAKTMNDYYNDQRIKAETISGILDAYPEAVRNKPGDFKLKNDDLPVAFVYSTQINLQDYVGKQVTLRVSKRPNNNFAFPAFFVHEIED